MRSLLACLSCLTLSAFAQPVAPDYQPALLRQAHDLYQKGNYKDAYTTVHQALRTAAPTGTKNVQFALILKEVGSLSSILGHFDEAEDAYLRAMRILENQPAQRLLLAQVLHELSRVYMQSGGRYAQAERLMQRVVALGTELLPPTHPDFAGMLANLASAQMMLGKHEEARALFHKALAILENCPPQDVPEKASILSNLGFLSLWRGDGVAARSYMEQSVALNETVLGPNHPELITGLLNLARLRLKLHHPDEAEEPVRRALTIAEAGLGHQHPVLYQVLSTYADVLRKSGKKVEARQMERRAKSILAANPDQASNLTVHVTDLFARTK